MSQTILFTPKAEQDDYFVVLTETGISAKIFKDVLPEDVTELFRNVFQMHSDDYFYGKSVSSDTLILLE